MFSCVAERCTAKLLSNVTDRTTVKLLFNKNVDHAFFQILNCRYRIYGR